jgi:hypothetical protein
VYCTPETDCGVVVVRVWLLPIAQVNVWLPVNGVPLSTVTVGPFVFVVTVICPAGWVFVSEKPAFVATPDTEAVTE